MVGPWGWQSGAQAGGSKGEPGLLHEPINDCQWPLLGTPCPLTPTDLAHSELHAVSPQGPSCLQHNSQFPLKKKKKKPKACGLGTKSEGKALRANSRRDTMTCLPGELGHSFHLPVLGRLSPSGGLSAPPRWLRSGPCPERIPLAPH